MAEPDIKDQFQEVVRSVMPERLQSLFNRWRDYAQQQGRAASFETVRDVFSEDLDLLLIAEPEAKSFVYRHYGQQFVDTFGVDLTGNNLDELDPSVLRDYRRFLVEFEYSYVLHYDVPIWRTYTAVFDGEEQTWHRLSMPVQGRWVVMGAVREDNQGGEKDQAATLLSFLLDSIPVRLTRDEGVDGFAVNVANISSWRMQGEEMERLATTDALTGLYNRRHLYQVARSELHRALRYEHGLALLLLDIDHFKSINDTHGHNVGDEALRHIANVLPEVLRTSDILARLGGEEFVVLLPEVDVLGAVAVAEKIRARLEVSPCETSAGPVRMTVSIGGTMADAETDPDSILARADKALYNAKDSGRNRVFFVD